MEIALITFILSGLGMALLLILKMVQNKYRVLLILPGLRNWAEARLQRKSRELIGSVSVKKDLTSVVPAIVNTSKSLARHVKKLPERRAGKLMRLIRGERDIEPKNSQSPFLHDITRYRDRFRDK